MNKIYLILIFIFSFQLISSGLKNDVNPELSHEIIDQYLQGKTDKFPDTLNSSEVQNFFSYSWIFISHEEAMRAVRIIGAYSAWAEASSRIDILIDMQKKKGDSVHLTFLRGIKLAVDADFRNPKSAAQMQKILNGIYEEKKFNQIKPDYEIGAELMLMLAPMSLQDAIEKDTAQQAQLIAETPHPLINKQEMEQYRIFQEFRENIWPAILKEHQTRTEISKNNETIIDAYLSFEKHSSRIEWLAYRIHKLSYQERKTCSKHLNRFIVKSKDTVIRKRAISLMIYMGINLPKYIKVTEEIKKIRLPYTTDRGINLTL